MTVATTVRALAELAAPVTGASNLLVVIAVGGLGQLAGAAVFVVNMWGRVRTPMASPHPPGDRGPLL